MSEEMFEVWKETWEWHRKYKKMKSITWILGFVVALAIILCYWVAYGQDVILNHAYVTPGKVGVEWKADTETRVWLSVVSADATAWQWEGYHPSFTYILVRYQPIVRKINDNEYEITFRPNAK